MLSELQNDPNFDFTEEMKNKYIIGLTYPELFLASTNFVLANLVFIPNIGIIYLLDQGLFVEDIIIDVETN